MTYEEWDIERKAEYPDGYHIDYESSFFISGVDVGYTVAIWYTSTGTCKCLTREKGVEVILNLLRNTAANSIA